MSREQDLLDLLSLGPSSFGALYGFLVRGGSPADVSGLWSLVIELERDGRVALHKIGVDASVAGLTDSDRAAFLKKYEEWLGPMGADIPVQSVAVDEIGSWVTRTASGSSLGAAGAWQLDEDPSTGTVVIDASDEATARAALARWTSRRGEVLSVATVVRVEGLQLRNGMLFDHGVRLVAEREAKPAR